MAHIYKTSLSSKENSLSTRLKHWLRGLVLIGTASAMTATATAKNLFWQSTSDTGWATIANWYDSGTAATSTTAPTSADAVTVDNSRGATAQPGVTTAGQAAKSLVVGSGFTLTISGASGGLQVGDGVAGNNDITIQNGGTIINSGTSSTATFSLVSTSTDKFRIDSGGTFVHNTTRSYTTPFPLGVQNFDANSTFIWRGSSSIAVPLNFSGRTFGNLLVESTSGLCTVAVSTGTSTCTVNGNLSIGATGAGTVNVSDGTTTTTSPWIVAGNLTIGSGSTFSFASMPITLTGNLTDNGTFTPDSLAGIFTFNGSASVVSGSAVPTFTGGFTVNSGKILTLSQNVTVNGATTNNGTLNCGTSVVSGTGNFTNSSSATLGIGSAAGITASGATGNIQVSGVRGFNIGANYIYNGTAAQVTGSGLPSSVNTLTITNSLAVASGGVTLSGGVIVTNQLALTAGRLITSGNQLIIADAATISPTNGGSSSYVDGSLQKAFASTGTKSFSFPIGLGAVFAPCSVTNAVVTAVGNLTATTTSSDHPNIGSSTIISTSDANRYWTITAGGGLVASSFSATCTPVNGDLDSGATIASFVMENWNGSSWTLASSSSVSGNTVTGNGFSSFGDFAVGQLQAISISPSGVGNSPTVGRGNAALLTVTVTPGSNPTSTGIGVAADLSQIGGSSTQTFYDDGTHGDVTSGDGVYSYSATVTTGTSVGIKSLPATITDAQSRTGNATISVTVAGVDRTWAGSGSDNNWSTAANWSGGVAPISPQDRVIFTGSTRLTPLLDTSYTVPGLTFDSSAGSFTLGAAGTSTLTLNGGTGITNNSANPETVNIPIILGSAQTIEAAGAGTFTFGGAVTNGGNLLTVDGPNNSAINAVVTGSGGLTKTGSGTLTLGGGNSYGGTTTVSGGTLAVSGGAAIPDASAVTLANAAGATLSLNASETVASLAGGGSTGGTVALGANNLTVGGTTTYSGAVTGTGKLIMTGAGTLTLNNAGAIGSSFTTRIQGGMVDLNLGGGAITNLLGSGNIVELAGGTLQCSGNVQANIGISFGELDVYSNSTLSINRNSSGTSSTSPTFGFPINFKSSANLSFIYNSQITGGTSSFNAATNTLQGNGELTLGAYGITIAGVIAESGGSYSLTKAGPGLLSLSSANTYSGNTTNLAGAIAVNSTATFGNGSGTLVLAGGDILSSASRSSTPIANPVLFTGSGTNNIYGNSTASPASTRVLPLSGTLSGSAGTLRVGNTGLTNEIFQLWLIGGGFTFTQPIIVGDPSFDTLGAVSQLQFNNDNTTASQIFTGPISGNGSVIRIGTFSGSGGTTILSGASTYSGGTTIEGGYIGFATNSTSSGGVVTSGPVGTATLEIQNDPTVGFFASGASRVVGNNIYLNGVTNLQILGTNDLTMSGAWNVGTLGKTLTVSNTGVTTISGVITSAAPLTKANSGTLVLSGVNLNTGNWTVSAGTLALSGGGSIATVPKIIMTGGATFDVSGLSSTFTLGSSQTLSNSTSTAILNGTNNTGSGTLALTFTAGTPSFIVTNGGLTLSANTVLNLNNTGSALGTGIYKIISKATTGNGGLVAGVVPTSFTVGGAGTTAVSSLQIINGELYLLVGATSVVLNSSANPSGYLGALTFNAAVQTNGILAGNATGNITFLTNGLPLSTNVLSGGTASSVSLNTLLRGTNLITAIYSGDVNYLPSTNNLNQVVTNHPPVAGTVIYTRNAGVHNLKIAISDLLTNVTDVDGDAIALVGTSVSTNGITLAAVGTNYLGYSNTSNVNDQLTYTVTDGYGGTNTAVLNIVINNSNATGQSRSVSVSGGTATVSFAGIPGYSYSVLRSTNLVSWATIFTTNAPANGVFNYQDNFSDIGGAPASAFYQLQWNH